MKRYAILLILLALALSALACNVGGILGDENEAEPTQPPAADTTAGDETAATTGDEPAPPAGDEPAPPKPAGAGGLLVNPEEALDSYRSRTTMQSLGDESFLGTMETEVEWVREPEARHTIMYDESGAVMMETITIGDDNWMSMGDGSWMKTPSGQDEQGMDMQDFQASMEDMLRDMEGGMDPDGTETVNGVKCKRYNVDAIFSIPMPMPEDAGEEAAQFMPTEIEGHVVGQIWVADQRGLPPVIIRSDTTQEITFKYASRDDETMSYAEVRDFYDINTSITIRPPEGAMELPSPPGGLPGASGQPGEAVETTSLDLLDSYRLEWTTTMDMADGIGMVMGVTQEWVREPPAMRLVMTLGGGPSGEYILIGDTVWINMGTGWMEGAEDDIEGALESLGDIMTPDDDMVLVGEETVNGVNCQHYVSDFVMADMTMHKEIWVADQSDLPPVVIRGLFKMETEQMTTEAEGNVYDINVPITIEPPQ